MKKLKAFLFALLLISFYFISCDNKTLQEGNDLSKKHCQSCHQYPGAELLDKKTWANYVLPKMSRLLGFRYFESGSYLDEGKKQQVMSLADWNKLVNYYITKAPDSLEKAVRKEIQTGLKNFEVTSPSFSVKDPATTYVGFASGQQLLFADGLLERLYSYTGTGLKDSFKVARGVVNIKNQDSTMIILAMGVLHPSDEKAGSLQVYNLYTKKSFTLLDSLQRPVYAEYGNLNEDTLSDIIICEFGNLTGQLSWFENVGNRKYRKHILRPLPGAVRTQIVDANRDGKPDIMALMAQGDEGIFIYYNKGNGEFEEKRVLQFPPSYGSNYFELNDFNGDGHPDLLVTNGDNGDYPPIIKPYHGIRIYLNDRKFNFKEHLFLPMNGVGKAMARDFDGDGDLDITSISYFPDYDRNPQESFVYWENKGDLSFLPFSFKEAFTGRWLTMEAGDVDEDGDMDILLGNAKFPLGNVPAWIMNKWNIYSPSILILKNSKVHK